MSIRPLHRFPSMLGLRRIWLICPGGLPFTILGNQGPGVRVSVANPRNIVLHQNDIYGNDSAGTPANCGVINTSAFPVDAKNNYWGSAAGPGVDPADKAGPGSDCDLGAGVTTVKPFAPTLFPIAP